MWLDLCSRDRFRVCVVHEHNFNTFQRFHQKRVDTFSLLIVFQDLSLKQRFSACFVRFHILSLHFSRKIKPRASGYLMLVHVSRSSLTLQCPSVVFTNVLSHTSGEWKEFLPAWRKALEGIKSQGPIESILGNLPILNIVLIYICYLRLLIRNFFFSVWHHALHITSYFR